MHGSDSPSRGVDAADRPHPPTRRPHRLVLVIVAAGLLITAFVVARAVSQGASERAVDTNIVLADATAEIEDRAAAYNEILFGLRGLFGASHYVSRAEFAQYIELNETLERYSGVFALEFTRLVPASGIEDFESQVRADTVLTSGGYPDFLVSPKSSYIDSFVVDYIVPLESNREAFGYDLGTDPDRRAAVEHARDTGATAATSGIELVQRAGEVGFLMLVPVYDQTSGAVDSIAQRRASFVGLVTGVFIVDEVLAGVIDSRRNIDLEVYDSGLVSQPPTMPSDTGLLFNSDATLHATQSGEANHAGQLATIGVGGRWWTIHVTPLAGSESGSGSMLPWILLASGLLLTLSLAGLVYALNRSRDHAVLIAAEMTEESTESARQMQHARDRAVAADKSKSEFLANMSHELRTPLTGVLGMSELLQNQSIGPLNDRQTEYVGQIRKSGQHLLSLINDLLDLAKIESGNQELNLGAISPRDLVEESVSLVRETAAAKGVELVISPDVPVWDITGDMRKLKQIVVNLLSNGIKFTETGGQVGIDVSVYRDHVDLTVWDSGAGIASDELETIFKPFTQTNSQRLSPIAGTGLGLSLSKSLAEMHGGTLTVSSAVGLGSRFTLVLPLSVVPPENAQANAADASDESRPRVSRGQRVVLVADDDPVIRTVLEEFLTTQGFTVHVAADGLEAVEMALSILPDVVLMDIRMPGIDGLEAAKQLRSHTEAAGMAIIALSAHAMDSDRILSEYAGCDAFVPKPIDFDLLIATVSAVAWQRHHTVDGHDSFRDTLHVDLPPRSSRVSRSPDN